MNFRSIGKAALPFAMIAGLGMTPAQAADLGGDCCADLEERIAELEATTVRKGNRVVSLKISGHVNQAVMYFDNGAESNTYVVDNTQSDTRIRFTGAGNISSDMSAGYKIELGLRSAGSFHVTEGNDDRTGPGDGIFIHSAYMYIKSKSLGTVAWGQFFTTAADNIDKITLVGGVTSAEYGDQLVGNSLGVYNSVNPKGTASVGNLAAFSYGHQMSKGGNAVIYYSPTIMGFSVSASWGEDDYVDAALRYANQFGDIRVAAGVGWSQDSDNELGGDTAGANGSSALHDTVGLGASGSVMHVPTGLFASVGWSEREQNWEGATLRDVKRSQYHVQAGIKQKFLPVGATTVYGEYAEFGGYKSIAAGGNNLTNDSSYYGFGVSQNFDAAAMELYAQYRNYSFDLDQLEQTNALAGNVSDITTVLVGGRIKF